MFFNETSVMVRYYILSDPLEPSELDLVVLLDDPLEPDPESNTDELDPDPDPEKLALHSWRGSKYEVSCESATFGTNKAGSLRSVSQFTPWKNGWAFTSEKGLAVQTMELH